MMDNLICINGKDINDSVLDDICAVLRMDADKAGTLAGAIRETLITACGSAPDNALIWLKRGIHSLLLFYRSNFVGPPLSFAQPQSDRKLESLDCFQLDFSGQLRSWRSPDFLYLAKLILVDGADVLLFHFGLPVHWWKFRCLMIIQRVAADRQRDLQKCIFTEIEACAKAIADEHSSLLPSLAIIFNLEAFQAHIYYFYVQSARLFLNRALSLAGMAVGLEGQLGKRTRYQEKDFAQLVLDVKIEGALGKEEDVGNVLGHNILNLPQNCPLNDDLLLNDVALHPGAPVPPNLNPVQQAVLLAVMALAKRSSAPDKLLERELGVYLDFVLGQPKNWIVQTCALIARSRLESGQKRKIERALSQVENLVGQFEDVTPPWSDRWSNLAFCCPLPPVFEIREFLGDLLMKLGFFQEALSVFRELECWEQVIKCYKALNKPEQAESIIREQLEIRESPFLWCCLGDVTRNPEHWEKSWKLSNASYAPAKRNLAMFYLERKQYEQAAAALELAVHVQPFDAQAWFNLGYCALQLGNYELAVKAFHRNVDIEPENHESWNNLAAAYTHLGQKSKAYVIMQESLKWDFENFRIWQNYLLLAVDTGHILEALHAYNRVMDLKESWLDCEILQTLERAARFFDEHEIGGENSQSRKSALGELATLLGRSTARFPSKWEIWEVFADVSRPPEDSKDSESWEKYLRRRQKVVACLAQKPHLDQDPEILDRLISSAVKLLEEFKLARMLCPEDSLKQLSTSIRLTAKSVLTRLQKISSNDSDFLKKVENFGSLFDDTMFS